MRHDYFGLFCLLACILRLGEKIFWSQSLVLFIRLANVLMMYLSVETGQLFTTQEVSHMPVKDTRSLPPSPRERRQSEPHPPLSWEGATCRQLTLPQSLQRQRV